MKAATLKPRKAKMMVNGMEVKPYPVEAKVVTFNDTLKLMLSAKRTDRLQAEHIQLRLRIKELSNLIVRYEMDLLDFAPKCSIEILKEQKSAMSAYAAILQERAKIEGIELEIISKE